MKSFIAALTQADRYVKPANTKTGAAANSTESSTAVRDAGVEDKYLALFDECDLTTVEVAAALNMKTNTVLRPLNRLAARGLLYRVDVEKAGGSMPTIVWSKTQRGECARNANARFCKALEKSDRDTHRMAKMCNVTYYTALARLKRMEADGLVIRVGVNRAVISKPAIIWRLKARNV